MATLLNPSIIAKEALMQLENHMVAGRLVHREYKKEFVKVGATVTIRKPVRFVVTDGATATLQNVVEQSTSIVVNKRKHVAWAFSTQELTLTIEEYSKRYIQPAMSQLANQIDMDVLALAIDVPFYVGTAGTTPNTYKAIADGAQKQDELCVPDDRILCVNPAANYALADALKGLFNPNITKPIIQRGYLGNIAKYDVYSVQNLTKTTAMPADKAGTVNDGAIAEGDTSITVNGLTANGMYKKGTIFTFADVYALNPVSKVVYPWLMPFVLTADCTMDGSGNGTFNFYPAIRSTTSGDYAPYRNIDALPVTTCAVTVLGDHVCNVGFHRNAFGLVVLPLEMPDGVSFKARESYNNLSVRVIKDYDFTNDKEQIRLDVFYGVKTLYPELAVRHMG